MFRVKASQPIRTNATEELPHIYERSLPFKTGAYDGAASRSVGLEYARQPWDASKHFDPHWLYRPLFSSLLPSSIATTANEVGTVVALILLTGSA